MNLIYIKVKDFKGLVAFAVEPKGKSVTLRGANGAGKSSVIDAVWFGLGGKVDEEVVRNGADRAEVELQIGDYVVARKIKRGGKATIAVRDAKGRSYPSPTELLRGFVGALERRTFSQQSATDQATTLRRLAPGLDVSDLEAKRAALYEERHAIGLVGKSLKGQLDGMPETVASTVEIGEERPIADVIDVAAIVERTVLRVGGV